MHAPVLVDGLSVWAGAKSWSLPLFGVYSATHTIHSIETVEMFEYSQADLDVQIAALPTMIQILVELDVGGDYFYAIDIFQTQTRRVIIVTSILLIAAATPITRMYGMTNLLSGLHLVLWVPLVLSFMTLALLGTASYAFRWWPKE